MPTGITVKLMDEGQTLSQYALTAVRGLSILSCMRDSKSDDKIPYSIKVDEVYYKELAERESFLAWLTECDEKESRRRVEEIRLREKRSRDLLHAEKAPQNQRLYDMERKINQWACPPELHALRSIMVTQITASRIRESDVGVVQTSERFYESTLAHAEQCVIWAKEELKRQQATVDRVNEFLKVFWKEIKRLELLEKGGLR